MTSSEATPRSPAVTRERDLIFDEVIGYRPLALDLWVPESDAPVPVLVHVHGGGFRRGHRREFSPIHTVDQTFGRMTAAGLAVASIDYRFSGEAVFPAQLDDVRAALAWVQRHGPEHGLDPSRIVLWGGSAGGTLAALVGLEEDSPVRGVIDWYGVADVASMADHDDAHDAPGTSRLDQWLGAYVRTIPERAAEASPVTHVHPDAPPFHIAHGIADTMIPPRQSEVLAEALRRAGVDVELTLVPDAGHFWQGLDADQIAPVFAAAADFALRVTRTPET
ncbi:alpha/beta hydrolase [Microbacterium sp. NPDC077184]|uniref:alpha/beta hydrolase n=1 Tax=Microbacterium sp. NPDC077184 TaxID=3154764 RepID=UPI00342A7F34